MKRTADRPLASYRWPLSLWNSRRSRRNRDSARSLAHALHQPAHRLACASHCLLLTSPSTRRSSASPPWPHSSAHFPALWAPCQVGPLLAMPHRVARRCALRHPLRLAVPALHVDCVALLRDDYARAGIRMLPVVQPEGWSTVVEAFFYAVLMILSRHAPWRLGLTGAAYAYAAVPLGLYLPRLHHPLRRRPPRKI